MNVVITIKPIDKVIDDITQFCAHHIRVNQEIHAPLPCPRVKKKRHVQGTLEVSSCSEGL